MQAYYTRRFTDVLSQFNSKYKTSVRFFFRCFAGLVQDFSTKVLFNPSFSLKCNYTQILRNVVNVIYVFNFHCIQKNMA